MMGFGRCFSWRLLERAILSSGNWQGRSRDDPPGKERRLRSSVPQVKLRFLLRVSSPPFWLSPVVIFESSGPPAMFCHLSANPGF